MINLAGIAAATAVLAAGAVDLDAYEGVARDSFAIWSYNSGAVAVQGSVRTISMMTRYVTPMPFNGNPTPVAYSIHTVTLDCAAKTVTYISGANYTASGALIGPGFPSAAQPWTDETSGFQDLAATVCTTNL